MLVKFKFKHSTLQNYVMFLIFYCTYYTASNISGINVVFEIWFFEYYGHLLNTKMDILYDRRKVYELSN